MIAVGVVIAYSRGLIRTSYEIDAHKARADRAEKVQDAQALVLDKLTSAVEALQRERAT